MDYFEVVRERQTRNHAPCGGKWIRKGLSSADNVRTTLMP